MIKLPRPDSFTVINSDSGSVEIRDNYTKAQMLAFRQAGIDGTYPTSPTIDDCVEVTIKYAGQHCIQVISALTLTSVDDPERLVGFVAKGMYSLIKQ